MTRFLRPAVILFVLSCPLLLLPLRPVFGKSAPEQEAATRPVPSNYREWIFLTSGIDMTYNTPDHAPTQHVFDNVFVNPEAYRAFLKTGTWPDKTYFVLENREGAQDVSINKAGHTQNESITGIEMHVKEGGSWKFYVRASATMLKVIPRPASCYTCHEAHGAVDTTFVQFYPTLLPTARTKNTFSSAYMAETPASK